MESELIDEVLEWSPEPVADGYTGLHDLADGQFSGAITDGDAWAFMLNGRVVGIFDGTIERFENAELDAYSAPDKALPLLYTMRLQGGETRAKYYTNETPLSEVDETLSEGGFTGYVELSENVLSGDYYVVYYGGRSMNVAFIGNNRRLVTGEEAFERANDEVGIYEVKEAKIDVVDVPEPPEPRGPAADESEDTGAVAAGEESESEPAVAGATEGEAAATSEREMAASEEEGVVDEEAAAGTAEAEAGATEREAEVASEAASEAESETELPGEEPEAPDSEEELTEASESEFTAEGDEGPPSEAPSGGDETASAAESAAETDREETPHSGEAPASTSTAEAASAAPEPSEGRRGRTQTAERLRGRVDELDSEVEQLESEEGATRTLSPADALAETNLFVRYQSKSAGTLQGVHEGQTTRETVNENLVLDYHANVDTEGLYVDGDPYEEFLYGSVRYEFARWLVTDLFYEIRDTGSRRVLDRLYDAIPEIDRIEFSATVEGAGEESFDVVCYDRMGNPLLVADVNDSRDPTTRGMMQSLVDRATAVTESADTLAGAFAVTTSYYGPDAMEVAAETTGGGLFSRTKRKSYVKISRKRGFHLCLAEARDGGFYLTVPDL